MKNKPLFKVSFGNDNAEDYHLNILTSIRRGATDNKELWLRTTSIIEAILIDRHFRKEKLREGICSVDFITGGGNSIDYIFKYEDETTATVALKNFPDYYRQIYDNEKEEDYLDGRIYPLGKEMQS